MSPHRSRSDLVFSACSYHAMALAYAPRLGLWSGSGSGSGSGLGLGLGVCPALLVEQPTPAPVDHLEGQRVALPAAHVGDVAAEEGPVGGVPVKT